MKQDPVSKQNTNQNEINELRDPGEDRSGEMKDGLLPLVFRFIILR